MKNFVYIIITCFFPAQFIFAFNRLEIPFNGNWKFNKGDFSDAFQISFNDDSWENISLPHTWNKFDGQDGGGYYRGPAWYRKSFAVPVESKGKKIFIRFGAANTIADVYINGKFAGEHIGGYAAFIIDITGLLNYRGKNLIAVKVDNTSPEKSGRFDVAPLSGDFTMDGGLYREVKLIITDIVHIDLLDYASPGVFIKPEHVTDNRADVIVTSMLKNDSHKKSKINYKTTIYDRDGNRIKAAAGSETLLSGTGKVIKQKFIIENPHLWKGKADPYLYKVSVTVLRGDKECDNVEQPMGLRYYKVDPEKGFFLNGEPYKLFGFCLHEDKENKGRAISGEDRISEMNDILDIGATFVRLAHYQHAPEFYDLCDKNGIVVWTEVGCVNGIDSTKYFKDNLKQQLLELIRQNYNHPSILFWGMFNEIHNIQGPDPASVITEMNKLTKKEDSYRLTTAASNNNDRSTAFITDVLGLNKYFGWYTGNMGDMGKYLDSWHKNHSGRAIGLSEYGSGGSIYQHEEKCSKPVPSSPWHSEEYQSYYHEQSWKEISERPYLWCATVWVGYDFASDGRREGFKAGINDKGLIAQDHLTKKDAYYWYKANWNPAPMIHITGKRFTVRDSSNIKVKVYSNAGEVELFVNGISRGKVKNNSHSFVWDAIRLNEGSNFIKTAAMVDGKELSDECWWRYNK